jgi:hypothetical protein
MQGQSIDSSTLANARAADEESREPVAQAAIVGLLLGKDHHGLWSKEELVRELSAPRLDVVDAIANLKATGLAHELGDFVMASRAAWHFDQLEL